MGKLLQLLLAMLKRSARPRPAPKPGPQPSTQPRTPPTSQPNCKTGCNLSKPPKPPARRHDPCKTKGNDPTKAENSMIDPDLDIGSDMEALARGDFVRDGEDLVVGQRRYGHHPDSGTVYPKSGPGIVQMDRAQHKLLKQLNDHPVDKALAWAKNVPGLDEKKIQQTLDLWRKCRK